MNLPEDSLYRRQLNRGFAALRFTEPLETDYRLQRFNGELDWLQRGIGVLLAWTLVQSFLEWSSVPESVWYQTLIARAVLVWPCLLLALSATYPKRTAKLLPILVLVSAGVFAISGFLSIVATQAALPGSVSVNLGITTTAIFVVLSLRFLIAVALVASVYGSFVALTMTGVVSVTAHEFALALCLAAIGAWACYRLEHSARTVFLETQIINLLVGNDQLTGVPNRRLFNAHLRSIWRQSHREGRNIAIALIDVDHFSEYNDRYGRHAGDVSLRRIAHGLMQITRRPLDQTARFGGEEFAMVLFDPEEVHLETLAAQIRDDIALLDIEHDDSPVSARVTVSVGIAFASAGSKASAESLLELADEALREAKESGRDRHVIRRYVHSKRRGNVHHGPWAVPN